MKYNRSVKYILLWNILFCLGLSVYTVLFNLYLKEVASLTSLGGIVGLSYIIYGGFSIVAGLLSDKIGPRNVLQIGIAILTVGITGSIFTTSTHSLYFWAIVTGVGQSLTNVMFVPLLTEHSENETRVKLFSIAFGTGNLFMFLGTMGAGAIADLLSTNFDFSSMSSLRWVILAGAAVIVLSILPLLAVKKSSQVQHQPIQKDQLSMRRKWVTKISTYGLVKLLEGIGIGLTVPFLNIFLSARFSLSLSTISLILSLATLLTVFIIFLNPLISKRIGEVKSIYLYRFISLPCLLLAGFTNQIWLCAVGLLFFRAFLYAIVPIQSKLLMEKIPGQVKGFTNSLGSMTLMIGMGVSGMFSMKFVSELGIYWGYIALFAVSTICLAVSLRIFVYNFIGSTTTENPKTTKEVTKAVSI